MAKPKIQVFDAETGELVEERDASMMILPAKKGTCAMCATDHPPHLPHNLQSVHYGVRFKMKYGRDPTWADASAHCTEEVTAQWAAKMEEMGHEFTYPEDGSDPIAEPYAIAGDHLPGS